MLMCPLCSGIQIGLHRNSAGGVKGIPEEVEKRRSLFWELLYLDARLVCTPSPWHSVSFLIIHPADCNVVTLTWPSAVSLHSIHGLPAALL